MARRLMTMDELKAWTTAAILFLVAVLLTGCATLAGYQAETARWQAKADEATAALGAGQVTVVLGPGAIGGYDRGSRRITLGVETSNKELLLSHELGHHVLGHSEGGRLDQEMAANAMAVRVLQVWGQSEEAAFRAVANALLIIQQRGSALPRSSGHAYCLEVSDLQADYPQYPPRDPAKLVAICPSLAGR